ncbi:MAG: DNA-binding transcriptional activator PspC [bacterium ADurb.Bin212]|nr:MAG: DNA-binding transcriptional activator PspC [bacterium ADurb.Bin212]
MESKFIRPKEGKIIAGVCLGIANYFKVDVVIVRLIFVVLLLADGVGAAIYIILLIVMPEEKGNSIADKIKNEFAEENKEKIKSGAKQAVGDIKKVAKNSMGETVFAYGLIIVGALVLLNNLFPSLSFGKSWPLLLVLIGVVLLLPMSGKEE